VSTNNDQKLFLVEQYRPSSNEWAPVPSGWTLYTEGQAIRYAESRARLFPGVYRIATYQRVTAEDVTK